MFKITIAVLGAVFYLIGCSSNNDGSTSGVASLENLPKGTGATSASAILAKPIWLQSASTGIQLDSWYTSFNGQTSKSQTFCQLGLMVKEVIRAASQPDKIGCYVGVMEKYASVTGWPSDGSDGNYHYVNLTGTGGGDGKIKFKVTKNGNVITGFEMFSGFGGSVQTEYIAMASSGGNITLTSVQYYTGSSGSNTQTSRGRVVVTGTVNSSGVWTSAKSIVAQSTRSQTGAYARTENARFDLTQYSDRFAMSGYGTGTEQGATFTNQGYAVIQLLTPNPLSGMALGEGTAKMSMTHSGYGSFSQTRAWNGDTGVPKTASTADYYSTVEATSLPTAPSSYDTSFTSAETWDLLPPSGTTATSVDFTAISANATAAADFGACNTNYGFSEDGGGNWPNCWSLSQN